MAKVSVIVPMYKGKNYIVPCISSLKRQGIDDLEIIVVDDRSPDDSYQYAVDLYKDDPQVRILEQEKNGGPGQARNRGLDEATGDYVCFADLDDLYIDGAIGKMLDVAEKNDADIVITSGMIVTLVEEEPDDLYTLKESELLKFVFESQSAPREEGYVEIQGDLPERCDKWLEHYYHWNVFGKIYKRSMLEKYSIRFPSISLGEDYLFCLNVLIHADKYVRMTDSIYIYRSNASSVSRGKGSVKLFNNALKTLFATPSCIETMTKGIPFFEEHPEYLRKLAGFQISSVEDYYAVPQFQQIGREALMENEDVAETFRNAFGEKADFIKKTLFDAYSAKPPIEIETGEGLENIIYRQKKKAEVGTGLLSVLP